MSEANHTIAILDDTRALLDAFDVNGWSSAIIRVGESQFAFSRALPTGGLAELGEREDAVSSPNPVVSECICAPHVGTVASISEVGRRIAKGEKVASLSVLDELVDVLASAGGTVLSVSVQTGALVEYGQTLLEISP